VQNPKKEGIFPKCRGWKNPVGNDRFICQCISDTLDGLRDGLSHFSSPSRAALIYAVDPEDPVRIYDPQNLLRGHEPFFKERFLDSRQWRKPVPPSAGRQRFGHVAPEKNLQLTGLISFGGRSGSVYYQMWFTEHHPDMCAIGPTERWLEHAAWRFSHDITNEPELYTGISGAFLREYATHAVRDHIIDEMNVILGWDTDLRVYPILDAILCISRTIEEGSWARGQLLFVERRLIPTLSFLAKFPENERVALNHFKHVRKLLLAVENSDRQLVSDGRSIVGIVAPQTPIFSLTANFCGDHGFLRSTGGEICSFSDGNFKSTTRRANLVQVEEILLEANHGASNGNALFKIISDLVHSAEKLEHGCTLVIDFNDPPVHISGQKIERPLDLNHNNLLDLAKSLARVDGALHISQECQLLGFACLLDGRTVPGEDRARGARYNSAVRFTRAHKGIFVVVVSEDHPVSVIQDGVEISAQCQWNQVATCMVSPPALEDWIDAA
jgi:hypothetical protein